MAGKASSGWYPDPQNPQHVRFWDGYSWTEQTRLRDDAPPMDTRDPWSADSQSQLGANNPARFSSTSGLSPAEASVARNGMPTWTWVVIGLSALGLIVGVVWVVWVAAGSVVTGTSQAPTPTVEPAAAEDVQVAAPTGDMVIWQTLNGLAVLEVPQYWIEDSQEELAYDPEAASVLGGTWNLDGRDGDRTEDFVYVWEYYGEDVSGDITIEELGQGYYRVWRDDFEVLSEETEVFTTANGYEAWRQTVTFSINGIESPGIQYVVRNGGAELSLELFRYGNLDGYEDDFEAMVNSVEFLRE